MSVDMDTELVTDFGRELIADVAPYELPVFPELAAKYFTTPAPDRRSNSDELLGFGDGAMLVMATPVALHVASVVIKQLVEILRAAAQREGGELVTYSAKQLFKIGRA